METLPERRPLKSYFLEKVDFVEESIIREFGFWFTLSLSNVDLRKEHRVITIAHISVFVLSSIIVIPLSLYTTYLVRDDIMVFTNSLHYSIIFLLSPLFVINMNVHAPIVFDVLYIMANNFYRYNESYAIPGVMDFKERMAVEKRMLILLPVLVTSVGAVILVSILIDEYTGVRSVIYQNGVNMKLIIPFYMPFESHEGISYYVANVILMNQLGISVVCVASTAHCYGVVFQHNILQFQILRLSLSQIEMRAHHLYSERYGAEADRDVRSEEFEECLIHCLKHNIQHYNTLRRFYYLIDDVIRYILLITLLVGSVIIALSVVLVFKGSPTIGNTLSAGALCLAEVANMFLMCIYGERLASESTEILTELYSVEWYNYGASFKSLVFTFRQLVATPLILMGGGLMPVNLETFSTLMKSAYSYYQFLAAI